MEGVHKKTENRKISIYNVYSIATINIRMLRALLGNQYSNWGDSGNVQLLKMYKWISQLTSCDLCERPKTIPSIYTVYFIHHGVVAVLNFKSDLLAPWKNCINWKWNSSWRGGSRRCKIYIHTYIGYAYHSAPYKIKKLIITVSFFVDNLYKLKIQKFHMPPKILY